MKKIKLFLVVLVSFINSCSGPDVPAGPPPPSLSDAAAFMETYLALASSCPAAAGTLPGQVGVLVVSSIIGADASGAFSRAVSYQHTYGKGTNILLPSHLLIANNHFEIAGSNHNKVLNYLNYTGDSLFSYTSRVEDFDEVTWQELINVTDNDLSPEEKVSALSCGRSSNVINHLNQKNILLSGNNSDEFDINNAILQSSLSSTAKTDLQNVVTGYVNRYIENSTNLDAINYLNSEIQNRVKPKGNYTNEEQAILGFLTVLKHSTYYWSN
ncbi:MAG TPA: hypothetical protein PKU77_15015 [Ferruginibacter sp.]|nr:hypothetical protein [Ferruginibacter sp.]